MDYVSPSIQGNIQLRFKGALWPYDLAMIYNKAFLYKNFTFNAKR